MSFSRRFFYYSLAFIAGVIIASYSDVNIFFYFGFLILGILIFCVFYQKKEVAILGLCFLFLVFGMFWEEKFEAKSIPSGPKNIHYFNNKGEITFKGTVYGEPERKTDKQKLKLKVNSVFIDNKEISSEGNVLLSMPIYPEYFYGDEILVKGKLLTPKEFPDFNYKNYLEKDFIYSVVYSPEIKVLSKNNGNRFFAKILKFKDEFIEVAQAVPPPEGALLEGMTLGETRRFSTDFQDELSKSGLSHIVAISGMNIIILFEIFLTIFLFFGLWRKQATFLIIIILGFYILFIGLPASAVRAYIMGIFLYLAKAIGRQSTSSRSIVFAGTAMIFQNPLIVARDVGFQLSFLASLGLIYVFPILKEKFSKKTQDSKIKDLILTTLAAQSLCFPLIVFNFGNIPVLSPISNILVVPFSPYLLAIGFIYLLLGFLLPILILPLSFIVEISFSWISFIAKNFALLNNFFLTPPFSLIFILVLIIALFIFLKKKTSTKVSLEKA